MSSWGVRARLEWDQAWRAGDTSVSPYVDLSYRASKLRGYTESGGGFPARFDSRQEKATELRWGLNLTRPISATWTATGLLEATHRLERRGVRTQGEVIGLFGFGLDGQRHFQDWLRLGLGFEGQVADGTASLMLNISSSGASPNAWLAVHWHKVF